MVLFSLQASTLLLHVASTFAQRDFLGSDSQKAAFHQPVLLQLKELDGSSHGVISEHLKVLEEALRPMFTALPKNPQGRLNPSSVRYALHRLFVQRHGWQMAGLASRGEAWNSNEPTALLGVRMPEQMRKLFEERLTARGLDLQELSVLAAAFEQMVRAEVEVRLSTTLQALGTDNEASMTSSDATIAIDAYMANFVLGANAWNSTSWQIQQNYRDIESLYPGWNETVSFLRQVQGEVQPVKKRFSFEDVSGVLTEVGERYGKWQSSECTALKEQLVKIEERTDSGRVRLADFYRSALHGDGWQFSESVAYLRQLGALDESDPEALRLIIPNYLLGPNNCVASSGYYAVCCIDECEGLLGILEERLKAPTASPQQLLSLVASLSIEAGHSNTSRVIPTVLQQRLVEIANLHGGKVPIHGRLFAQWMHHIFPRECPYPHVSGTTNPLDADKFEAATGFEMAATKEEMEQHIEAGRKARHRMTTTSHEEGLCSSMWNIEEELVDPEAFQLDKSQKSRAGLRGLVLAAAVISTLSLIHI